MLEFLFKDETLEFGFFGFVGRLLATNGVQFEQLLNLVTQPGGVFEEEKKYTVKFRGDNVEVLHCHGLLNITK
jgi:hypothetical protein